MKPFKDGGSENLDTKDNPEAKPEKSKPKALEIFEKLCIKIQDFKDNCTERMRKKSETGSNDDGKPLRNQILALPNNVKESKKVDAKEDTKSKTEKDRLDKDGGSENLDTKDNPEAKPEKIQDFKDNCTERMKKKSETGSNDGGDNNELDRDFPKDMGDAAKQKALEQEKAKKESETTEQTQTDEQKYKENNLKQQSPEVHETVNDKKEVYGKELSVDEKISHAQKSLELYVGDKAEAAGLDDRYSKAITQLRGQELKKELATIREQNPEVIKKLSSHRDGLEMGIEACQEKIQEQLWTMLKNGYDRPSERERTPGLDPDIAKYKDLQGRLDSYEKAFNDVEYYIGKLDENNKQIDGFKDRGRGDR